VGGLAFCLLNKDFMSSTADSIIIRDLKTVLWLKNILVYSVEASTIVKASGESPHSFSRDKLPV